MKNNVFWSEDSFQTNQRGSRTIEWQCRIFTLLVQLYFYIPSVNYVFVSDKIIYNRDNFGIKYLSYSKISVILCYLFSVLKLFYLILENMSTYVRKFCFPSYI